MSELGIVTNEVCPRCGAIVDTTLSGTSCPKCGNAVETKPILSGTKIMVGAAILLAVVGGLAGRQLGYFAGVVENRKRAKEFTTTVRTAPRIEMLARPITDDSGSVTGYEIKNGPVINVSRCIPDGRCPDNEGILWEIIKP